MAYLSPASQAVMNATRAFIAEQLVLADRPIKLEHITAAALRAAADQVVPPDPCGNVCCITQCEQIRQDVLAIAAELGGTQSLSGTH